MKDKKDNPYFISHHDLRKDLFENYFEEEYSKSLFAKACGTVEEMFDQQ